MMFPRHIPHRRLAGLLLALSAITAQAQQPDVYRPITAKELLAGFMEGGLAPWVQDPAQRASLSTFMATAYVLGAADSAKGRQWCPVQDARVSVLLDPVMDYLADLPSARQDEDAAKIVVEALGKNNPC